MNKFDNMTTADIEVISNALCIYTSMIADDPNKADRKVEAAVIYDLLNDIDDRNKDRVAGINAELNAINVQERLNPDLDSKYNLNDYGHMNFDDFINSFDESVIVNDDDDLDEYNT
jgi:hypothetical protein